MSKLATFLWFEDRAEEAANFYVSIFTNSKITSGSPSGDESVTSISFELDGQEFIAFNGGPLFSFSPATSFFVKCQTQEEVDHYWESLSANGGEKQRCAWLKDKYGVTWQIVPNILGELLADEDPVKAKRVLDAMLQMEKIEIAELMQAYNTGI
jgi:predicted 3-demethylubiquinone-9 3-methyltransferase (glyoxalase superfamily)